MLSFLQKQRLLPRYSNIPYTPLSEHPNSRRRFANLFLKIFLGVAIVAGVVTSIILSHNPRLDPPRMPIGPIPVIPKHFRTVGLVFYGRRSRVEILDCYLKVIFIPSFPIQSKAAEMGKSDLRIKH